MQNFEGKVAFITGGASGIGLGMARNFIAEGMKVVIADWNDDHLDAVRKEFAGSNAVHFIKLDVSDREQMKKAAAETLSVFGKVHVVCNNAGVGGGGAADDPEFDDWDRALSINLGGVVNGVKVFAPIIKEQGEGGHIVNTSSMAGIVPLPGLAAYSTAKYAVRGYTESLRLALAPHGIGVSCLYPGAVKTALVPAPEDDSDAPEGDAGEFLKKLWEAMRKAMSPDEMGAAVVNGIRENRPHILTHGEFLQEVMKRNREMEAAFMDMGEIPEARSEFEKTRNDMVDGLMNLPVKD
ncbi:SDR family oxidoreductase [Hyphococcus sp.]|uniref:SDR family oxidoreductase n=1 Tax=Hyphococcus sp. TaxID=2038636 RepID=UPI003D0C1C10